ncbi:MAG: hypothetical protein ACOCVX_05265, partial [Bacteroidales bacterium]
MKIQLKKPLLFIALTAVMFTLPVFSQSDDADYGDLLGQDQVNTITTAVPFLMIAPDARAGAMGDAGVSSRPDANSMHWNPAKYAFAEQEMALAAN